MIVVTEVLLNDIRFARDPEFLRCLEHPEEFGFRRYKLDRLGRDVLLSNTLARRKDGEEHP